MKYTKIEKIQDDRAYLHFEATRTEVNNVQVDYELVLPLNKLDCRGTFGHRARKKRPKITRMIWLDSRNNLRIPLGRTFIVTENKKYPFYDHPSLTAEIELPFREGTHQMWDNDKLGGLPVIYSHGNEHWALAKAEKS